MTQESGTAKLTVPVGQRDHQRGSETARVTLVEYGDYESPSCGKAYPIVKGIQRRLADQCTDSFFAHLHNFCTHLSSVF